MRVALGVAASVLMAFGVIQPAAADHARPWVRLEIGIPVDRIFDDGVIVVSRGTRYWVPDGYREYRECRDRRHSRYRHAHVYYDPGRWHEESWRRDRWEDDQGDDDDGHRRKKRKRGHHHSYRDYGHRDARGSLVLTIPLN